MLNIHPLTGYLPQKASAKTVICPAYDTFTPAERRVFAEKNPDNFINTFRYIDEFEPHEGITLNMLLKQNKQYLQQLLAKGLYRPVDNALLVYQLETTDGHIQTGVIADIPYSDYEKDAIRIHEYTRKEKEKGLAKYIKKVGVVPSPVCITYPQHTGITDITQRITQQPPDIELTTDITQRAWVITDANIQSELRYHFQQVGVSYLADGHHRIASGHRFAKKCRQQNPEHTGNEPYNYMLGVLFPDNEMRIHAYNRCVKHLPIKPATLLRMLESDFLVEKHDNKYHAQPMNRQEFGMLLGHNWYKLICKPHIVPTDPVGSLAVSILQQRILAPMLGISDPQRDDRLEYISGDSHIAGMEQAIAAGFEVVFATFPTAIQEMMAVADCGQIMPPKSTWFAPKVRSGIFIRFRK